RCRLPATSWKKSVEVEPDFGVQPLGLNSIARPLVPGIGMRTTLAWPTAYGMPPDIGMSMVDPAARGTRGPAGAGVAISADVPESIGSCPCVAPALVGVLLPPIVPSPLRLTVVEQPRAHAGEDRSQQQPRSNLRVHPSTSARRAPGREDEERRRETGEDVFREHDRRKYRPRRARRHARKRQRARLSYRRAGFGRPSYQTGNKAAATTHPTVCAAKAPETLFSSEEIRHGPVPLPAVRRHFRPEDEPSVRARVPRLRGSARRLLQRLQGRVPEGSGITDVRSGRPRAARRLENPVTAAHRAALLLSFPARG